MRITVPSTSKETLLIPVRARANGEPFNPSAIPVAVAFTDGSAPAVDDWQTASWENEGASYYAGILVGPGSDVGALSGTKTVWVRLSSSPEMIILRAGTVTFD